MEETQSSRTLRKLFSSVRNRFDSASENGNHLRSKLHKRAETKFVSINAPCARARWGRTFKAAGDALRPLQPMTEENCAMGMLPLIVRRERRMKAQGLVIAPVNSSQQTEGALPNCLRCLICPRSWSIACTRAASVSRSGSLAATAQNSCHLSSFAPMGLPTGSANIPT